MPTVDASIDTQLREAIKRHWGYGDFLPLQREAMHCVMESRDSVVVLPTGGGKSLCFQTPAICLEGLAVVVSPLISLMVDQVYGLTACGVRRSVHQQHDVVRRTPSSHAASPAWRAQTALCRSRTPRDAEDD